jgi:hypothetical protein
MKSKSNVQFLPIDNRLRVISLAHEYLCSVPDDFGRKRSYKKGVIQYVLSKTIWARSNQELIESVEKAFYEMQNKNYGILMPWGNYIEIKREAVR